MNKKQEEHERTGSALVPRGLATQGFGGAGLVGLGASRQRRVNFSAELDEELLSQQCSLVSCALGRNGTNAPVWKVTLQHPVSGVMSFSAEFPAETEVYTTSTARALAQRILRHFSTEK